LFFYSLGLAEEFPRRRARVAPRGVYDAQP
jgi:hypothetical protein